MKIHMTPERGKAGKPQVFRLKKKQKKNKAYNMSTENFKRNGQANPYFFFIIA